MYMKNSKEHISSEDYGEENGLNLLPEKLNLTTLWLKELKKQNKEGYNLIISLIGSKTNKDLDNIFKPFSQKLEIFDSIFDIIEKHIAIKKRNMRPLKPEKKKAKLYFKELVRFLKASKFLTDFDRKQGRKKKQKDVEA